MLRIIGLRSLRRLQWNLSLEKKKTGCFNCFTVPLCRCDTYLDSPKGSEKHTPSPCEDTALPTERRNRFENSS